MDVLIIILLCLVVLSDAFMAFLIIGLEKWVETLCEDYDKAKPKPEEAKVTDPFTKPAPIFSSTQHIVVPKTATEIRNQNFKKIKEGAEYGGFNQG